MQLLNGTVSRRDAALVAAALLLPIPVLAQSGLSVPLPGAVERSLGALVTIDSGGSRTTVSAKAGAGATSAEDKRPSAHATASVRKQHTKRRFVNGRPSAAGVAVLVSDQPVGDGTFGGGPPAGDDPGAAGGGSGTGAPGDPSSPSGQNPSGSGGSTGSDGPSQSAPPPSSSGETTAPPPPGLSVSAGGPGSGAGASVGEGGLAIDLGGNTDGADDGGGASVEVTDQNGSSTGLEIPLGVPGGLLGP